jgi:hypothetical protein
VLDTLMRVAQLVSDHPEITSADLNPIIVSADGAATTDATIEIDEFQPVTGPLRRLD